MNAFQYRQGQLHAEQVPVSQIAQQQGTPCYVYSRAALEQAYQQYVSGLGTQPGRVHYAVKANANLAVLQVLARQGAGFDIVSVGELERVLAAGGDASRIIFSGVGKQAHEMQRALQVGIGCFNIESTAELERLQQTAQAMDCIAPISIRVNPDIDAKTHPYISTGLRNNKFGIAMEQAFTAYCQAAQLSHIRIKGVDCHIGSQLTQVSPFVQAVEAVLHLIDQLKTQGIIIEHLDIGGGLGVCYHNEQPPAIVDYMQQIIQAMQGRPLSLWVEPGRSIAAHAGILLTQVEYLKRQTSGKQFAIVDAAMNDLLRPSLYQAYHPVCPVQQTHDAPQQCWDIVGPVCETGDFIGQDRLLALTEGDLLAIKAAGAYGFAMASNYNSRNRAAEVMVDGDRVYLVRRRECLADQLALESLLPGGLN